MDNGTVVQIVAGVIFVILLVILVQRRRNRVR
jgi:high-affinity Fe2+/Pb2+ permease